MKILLSICYLVHRSGAELFVRDLALSLNALGHSVVVFAPVMGEMVEELRLRCIACVTDLKNVAAAPDVIIGSTQHETAICLAHFAGIPAVSICHDRTAAHGQPPLFSRIRRHVAVDANCRERLVFEHGIAESSVVIIQNGVDVNRFRPRPPLPERPVRAAIFSNYATRSRDTEAVARACAELGISLDVIGEGSGNQSKEPAAVLGGYDLVFAKARCAMEAMAVGCAVILLNEGMGLAGMVTPDNVRAWQRWNFGRRLLQRPIEAGSVREAISGYAPAAAAAVSEYLRSNASLEKTAAAFSRLAETVVAEETGRPAVEAHQENREFARYVLDVMRPPGPASVPVHVGLLLAELAQERRLRADLIEHERGARETMRAELDGMNERWALVQRSVSWRITAPLRWVAGRLRKRAQA
jgi:glycosyltransferase involved in cell wall biosynthesis